MTRLFEERERAAELIFARAEETRFVLRCHGIRSLAAFAASKLGLDGLSADAYAQELLSFAVNGMKDADLIDRVRADLAANGVIVHASDLRTELLRGNAQPIHAFGAILDGHAPTPHVSPTSHASHAN